MPRVSVLLILALAVSACVAPRGPTLVRATPAEIGAKLDNYGEAVVPADGLVVLQGDDLVYGSAHRHGRPGINGADTPRSSPTLSETLRRVLAPVRVENRGYPGDTILNSAKRWAGRPGGDLMIFAYGFGDLEAKTPLDVFDRELRRQVRLAHAQGAAVFLLVWPSLADPKTDLALQAYRDVMRRVGPEENAEVFEGYLPPDQLRLPRPKGAYEIGEVYKTIAGSLVPYIQVVGRPR